MMRRYDLGDGIVEIRHSDGSDRWLVVKKVLDASKISLQVQFIKAFFVMLNSTEHEISTAHNN